VSSGVTSTCDSIRAWIYVSYALVETINLVRKGYGKDLSAREIRARGAY
jgi:hypothetical protein